MVFPDAGLGKETLDFIDRYVRSVEQLEILFLLWKDPNRSWTAPGIAAELRNHPASTERCLRALVDGALVVTNDPHTSPSLAAFHYEPATAELDRAVKALAADYALRRHRVIDAIYSRPLAGAHFANAFIVRKEP